MSHIKWVSPKRLSIVVVSAVVTLFASTAFAAPTPIQLSGNPSCATLNASTNPAFAHITEDFEFKVDPPVAGALPLTGSGVGGGMTPNANLFLNLAYSNDRTLTSWSLSWTSPQFLDRLVSAVIVKGGPNGANVYPYNPLDAGDTGQFTVPGGGQAISHLSFCFEISLRPSAADAEVSGRVIDRTGRGISGAVVTIVNLNTGESRRVVTNTFGHYTLKGLEVANIYNLAVTHNRYRFRDPVRTFQLDDSLADVTFSAER